MKSKIGGSFKKIKIILISILNLQLFFLLKIFLLKLSKMPEGDHSMCHL